jgi:threonine dehydrogenase-like Zn-dependent dehydrogenase
MGASAAIPAGKNLAKDLKSISPDGFNIVIDATGVPAVIEESFDYLAPRGQYLQFGVTPIDSSVNINPYDFFKNDWIMLGSYAVNYSFKPAIDWLENGVINIDPLVSHTVPMSDFKDVFNQFDQGNTLKVHIQINK